MHDYARLLLATIRLINGGLGLLLPQLLARRLGVDPSRNPAMLYVLRMFGIRTILIGADLLLQTGERRTEALRRGIVIHASDTLAALLAALSGRLPPRMGATITLISAANTALAVYAWSGEPSRQGRTEG